MGSSDNFSISQAKRFSMFEKLKKKFCGVSRVIYGTMINDYASLHMKMTWYKLNYIRFTNRKNVTN